MSSVVVFVLAALVCFYALVLCLFAANQSQTTSPGQNNNNDNDKPKQSLYGSPPPSTVR